MKKHIPEKDHKYIYDKFHNESLLNLNDIMNGWSSVISQNSNNGYDNESAPSIADQGM